MNCHEERAERVFADLETPETIASIEEWIADLRYRRQTYENRLRTIDLLLQEAVMARQRLIAENVTLFKLSD